MHILPKKICKYFIWFFFRRRDNVHFLWFKNYNYNWLPFSCFTLIARFYLNCTNLTNNYRCINTTFDRFICKHPVRGVIELFFSLFRFVLRKDFFNPSCCVIYLILKSDGIICQDAHRLQSFQTKVMSKFIYRNILWLSLLCEIKSLVTIWLKPSNPNFSLNCCFFIVPCSFAQ